MVLMIVAVDDVLYRLVKSLGEFGLEPLGDALVDGIGRDDSIGCHEEHGKVKVVLEPVQVAGDFLDRPLGWFAGGMGGGRGGKNRRRKRPRPFNHRKKQGPKSGWMNARSKKRGQG